ncbi:MAG: N-terminal methylation site-containing protein [Gemmatimonadetes bacterium]|nr:N-terminal methylation site-containing protein [Gemmatimonadota bacterium]
MRTLRTLRIPRGQRRGFTLVETIVTVGILSVLAAFVVPSVLNKADSADPVKVANDLNSISTAIQSFASDVKGTLPGDLEDLTAPLLTNASCNTINPCDSTVTHTDIYTAQQVRLWHGPYLSASIAADPAASLRSGYVAEIHNMLTRFDSYSGVPEFCTSIGTQTVPCAGFIASNPLYVAVRVDSLNLTQALTVNAIIDGPNESQPGLQGRFRFPSPPSPTALATPAYFLATPVP